MAKARHRTAARPNGADQETGRRSPIALGGNGADRQAPDRRRSEASRSSTSGRAKVLAVIGTRPEAIKLSPVILALRADHRFESVVVTTGQHQQLVDPLLATFG